MKIAWSSTAWEDVDRLHAFRANHDPDAADALFDKLAKSPELLLDFPRRGTRVSGFNQRDVREFRVSNCVLRYEVTDVTIFVLRFFNLKEDRDR